ncbi:hypothetical protein SPI_04058 [Niveomyces insectorum RCEF 264]|uniref:Uncharacterized protein n=1 Tax=Niveomyces insectorum RCEF 264 TaxID=1081102 RepID=A0A167VE88_9HYPO|nr:hypothetical protein SPI_04058 [Niveomyces insectorum RCEF 264]
MGKCRATAHDGAFPENPHVCVANTKTQKKRERKTQINLTSTAPPRRHGQQFGVCLTPRISSRERLPKAEIGQRRCTPTIVWYMAKYLG